MACDLTDELLFTEHEERFHRLADFGIYIYHETSKDRYEVHSFPPDEVVPATFIVGKHKQLLDALACAEAHLETITATELH